MVYCSYLFLILVKCKGVMLMNLMIHQVDPTTGEAEDDGVEDEYQLEDLEVVTADYMLKLGVSNFRNAWESLGPDCERVDEYGLGPRESLTEAVNAVINLLGMQPCEVYQIQHSLLKLLFKSRRYCFVEYRL